MKDKIMSSMQKFSRIIIRPVMFMSLAGLLISISAVLKMEFMPTFIQQCGSFLFNLLTGSFISQMAVIFCVSLTTSIAKTKKNDAAIVGIVTFLLFLVANNQWLTVTNQLATPGEYGLAGTGQAMVLGFQVVDMGVFLGILLGCVAGYVFNKYHDKKLHKMIAPYEGTRFVYFVMIFVSIFLAITLSYVWPFINGLIEGLVNIISKSGSFGFFIYGFANRMLLPMGLHSLLYMPILFSPLGGTATVAGASYAGALNIWLAEIGSVSQITAIHSSVGYLANFGFTALPLGICLALIHTAKPEHKSKVKAIVLPALFAAMFAEITEPIEFLFLFTAPILWVFHGIVYGFGLMLSNLVGLNIEVSTVIKTVMNSIIIPMELGRQWLVPILFVILTAVEFFVFKFVIEKWDLKLIGRTDTFNESENNIFDDESELTTTNRNYQLVVDGLGGVENIKEINNCITRLRIDLLDDSLVNKDLINQFGNSGIISKKNHIQIVIGMGVEDVREGLEAHIKKNL